MKLLKVLHWLASVVAIASNFQDVTIVNQRVHHSHGHKNADTDFNVVMEQPDRVHLQRFTLIEMAGQLNEHRTGQLTSHT